MADLFQAGDSDSDDVGELKLNEDYAKNYNKWREKEELQKLKDKYGEEAVALDSSSSSSESEDEDAEELTPALEKKFLETLSALKSKDPKIYDKDTVFFRGTEGGSEKSKDKTKKDKPMFLKDYERKVILEKKGVLSDDEEDGDESSGLALQRKPGHFATAAEEEQLKRSFKAALADSEDDDSGDEESLLKTAKPTKDQEAEADEEYRRWLKGEVDKIQHQKDAEKLGYLHSYWNSSNLEESEAFLRDYILNKRYLDRNQLPSARLEDQEDLSEDEATLQEQEVFEHKFNYRFEEPDTEFIKKYPRTMQDSMRRKDDRRKVKRQEVRERKIQEKEQKREEINRLKALKKKEILEKLERLKEVTGNDQVGFADVDIEGDFDPAEHDRRMNAIFNSGYYDQEAEELKPEDPVDEELGLEDWDQWQGEEGEEGGEEGEWTENYDDSAYHGDVSGDYEDPGESEWPSEEMQGKRRKKSHFAKVISRKKPVFDPSNKTFEEYFDEYYKLDFEDIVGGMPTRFRYRSVMPNDFGLTTEEILSAKDKELNRWCSVKKTCQHRTENEEMQDRETFRRRASNFALKRKIFPSLFEAPSENKEEVVESESQTKKRRRKKKKTGEVVNDTEKVEPATTVPDTSPRVESYNSANFGTNAVRQKQKAKRPADVELSSLVTNSQRDTSTRDTDLEPAKKFKASLKDDSSLKVKQGAMKQNGQTTAGSEMSESKKKRKRKKPKGGKGAGIANQQKNQVPALKVSDNRLKAYGLNPKKLKRQMIYGKRKDDS